MRRQYPLRSCFYCEALMSLLVKQSIKLQLMSAQKYKSFLQWNFQWQNSDKYIFYTVPLKSLQLKSLYSSEAYSCGNGRFLAALTFNVHVLIPF